MAITAAHMAGRCMALGARAIALYAVFGLPCGIAAPPMVVGGTMPLSGPGAAVGAAMLNASVQFANMVNAAGGVNLDVVGGGRARLVLDFTDDGGTGQGVRDGYAAQLARGVSLFLGPLPPFDLIALGTVALTGRPTAIVLPASSTFHAHRGSALLISYPPRTIGAPPV